MVKSGILGEFYEQRRDEGLNFVVITSRAPWGQEERNSIHEIYIQLTTRFYFFISSDGSGYQVGIRIL